MARPTKKSLFIFWGAVLVFIGGFVVIALHGDKFKNEWLRSDRCAEVTKTYVSHAGGYGTGFNSYSMITFSVDGEPCDYNSDPGFWTTVKAGEAYNISVSRNTGRCDVTAVHGKCEKPRK
ncbi:MAG: hypothetical protein HY074_07105 [Deltaproteobacteria bacterium]|nr:hypothetical protein [Deltaproteobacteria bacterium]